MASMSRSLLIQLGGLMTALWLTAPLRADNPEDAKLAAFFRKYLDEEFKHQPSYATRLGDHRYDHLLEDVSPQAVKAADERTRKALASLKKDIDFARLSRG